MRTYTGIMRINGTPSVRVRVDNKPSRPLHRQGDLFIPPDQGFDWGGDGLGSQLLAHAILFDAMGAIPARDHYLAFMRRSIVTIEKGKRWEMTDLNVRRVIRGIEGKQ